MKKKKKQQKKKINEGEKTDIRYCMDCNKPFPLEEFEILHCGISSVYCRKCRKKMKDQKEKGDKN